MCRSRDKGMDRETTGVPIRYRQPETDDFAGDHIGCTGSSCRSCTAALIADCVAIGCCPCAVLSMLALALVKLPWRASRKCLRSLRLGGGRSLRRRVRDDGCSMEKVGKMTIVRNGDETKGSESIMEAAATTTTTTGEGDGITNSSSRSSSGRRSLCSRLEADQKIWMELYHRGHWGFGRVSFTGNLIKEGNMAGKRPSVSSPNASAADVVLMSND